jgi:hypothetical protein
MYRDMYEGTQLRNFREWNGFVAHVNDLLNADVKELLTPYLATKILTTVPQNGWGSVVHPWERFMSFPHR